MNYEVTDENICSISFESYAYLRQTNAIVCTPCSHLFQDIALMQWLTVKPSCPICRHIVHLDDIVYGELPKETLLKKIQNVFFSIIGGVRNLFTEISKAIKGVFSADRSFIHDPDIEANWPLVVDG